MKSIKEFLSHYKSVGAALAGLVTILLFGFIMLCIFIQIVSCLVSVVAFIFGAYVASFVVPVVIVLMGIFTFGFIFYEE